MITKYDLTRITKTVRKQRARETAPGLVAAIKMIVASSRNGSQGTIWYWNDSTDKMKCDRFDIWKNGGPIKWNYNYSIDEPTLTRHIEGALVKGAILLFGDYAAVLDGTWHGLTKEQAVFVGSQSDWPILQKQSYDEIREGLLSLAATELPPETL